MTTHRDMGWERYLQLLEAYGADWDRWPANERTAAERLVLASEAARLAREQARALDELLDQAPSVEASNDLGARIHEIPRRAAQSGSPVPRRGWFGTVASGFALAAAALLGIAAGSFAYEPALEEVTATEAEMTAEDWDELTELAFAADLEGEDWP
jgi:hypothetical protein